MLSGETTVYLISIYQYFIIRTHHIPADLLRDRLPFMQKHRFHCPLHSSAGHIIHAVQKISVHGTGGNLQSPSSMNIRPRPADFMGKFSLFINPFISKGYHRHSDEEQPDACRQPFHTHHASPLSDMTKFTSGLT